MYFGMATYGDTLYNNASYAYQSSTESFDGVTWVYRPSMLLYTANTGVFRFAIAVPQGLLYALGGTSSSDYCHVQAFDGNTWTTKYNAATSDLYRSLVQSLNYIVVYTRPDMKFTQGKVAKYMADPGPVHWTALKHYIRYLAGTPGHGLLYSWHRSTDPNQTQDDHVVHSDSSHQDCPAP